MGAIDGSHCAIGSRKGVGGNSQHQCCILILACLGNAIGGASHRLCRQYHGGRWASNVAALQLGIHYQQRLQGHVTGICRNIVPYHGIAGCNNGTFWIVCILAVSGFLQGNSGGSTQVVRRISRGNVRPAAGVWRNSGGDIGILPRLCNPCAETAGRTARW